MAYQHDIFISYRRNPETYLWIIEHFVPLLQVRVEFEIGRKPDIFVDDQIESGTSWPAALGVALGASRVLIPLWTGNYLSSVWCMEELSHMLAREKAAGLRTAKRPHGVIVPAIIHDGDRFPKDLKHIQHFEIQKTFNLRMARNSARAEELDAMLTAEAPAIAACIENAPPWRKQWPAQATAKFFKRFHQKQAVQTTVPRFTTP
jgi:hypothetical protein